MIKPQKIYHPLYEDKEKFVILITGGRGSGKSFNASTFIERLTFEKSKDIVHKILYTRYTMVSAGISVIPEFMEKIEADGTSRYFKSTKTDIRNKRTGSVVMFRGIKTSSGNQTAKLKSIQGITTFVVDEAEEWRDETDYDRIRLSIRQMGIQNRIIIIMNPSDEHHMIYRKYIKDTHRIEYYDGVPVQISTHPNVLHIHTTYLDNADHLSPQFLSEVEEMKESNPDKYAHVIMGRWNDVAEGAIFKKYGVVKEFPQWCKKVGIGIDFGYTNDPTAIVKCGVIDNALYVDLIAYRSGMLASDIIKALKNYPYKVIADSADPRLIDEIRLGGINIHAVEKGAGSILAGIDKILDMELYVTERSYELLEELRKYSWDKDKDGRYINTPIDACNHCFSGDTLITTIDGDIPIESIKAGDLVLTSQGYRKVVKLHRNGFRKIFVIKIKFANFVVEVKATPDHLFKTTKGWKKLKHLTKTDVLFASSNLMAKGIRTKTEHKDTGRLAETTTNFTEMFTSIIKEKSHKAVFSLQKMAIILMSILRISFALQCRILRRINWQSAMNTQISTESGIICTQQNGTIQKGIKGCIGKYGSFIMERFQKGVKYITRILTQKIIRLKTSNVYQPLNIRKNIENSRAIGGEVKSSCNTWNPLEKRQRSGIKATQVGSGIGNTERELPKQSSPYCSSVKYAKMNTTQKKQTQSSALIIAKPNTGIAAESITKRENVKYVERYLQPTNIVTPNFAHAVAVENIVLIAERKIEVFDIEVEGVHEYFANGVLVHNSIDALRYFVLGVLLGKVKKPVTDMKGIFR